MSPSQRVLVLSGADVAKLTDNIKPEEVIRMIGRTMSAITLDNSHRTPTGAIPPIQNPLRIATSSEAYKTLYMPSRLTTKTGSATAIKVVAVPTPAATLPGLPATTLVFDEGSGRCEAMVNASELTGLRTAAASALASVLLAKADSRRIVVFGTGTQAYYHARLILELFPSLTHLTFIARSLTPRAGALLKRLLLEFPQITTSLVTADGTPAAIGEADIICLCVPSTSPVFAADDLKEGVHINAIGSYQPHMFEFPPELISPSPSTLIPRILVDAREAVLSESGEVIKSGIAAKDLVELGDIVDEEGQLIPGSVEKEGLRKNGASLFKCVGIGGMDVGVTTLMVKLAKESGVGTYVDF